MDYLVGTRGSLLAKAQTSLVTNFLNNLHKGDSFIEEVIKTCGDRKQGTKEAACGDKRDWMHELEVALTLKKIDLAVHSAKDVPVDIQEDTVLVPVFDREFPGDVFVGQLDSNGRRKKFSELLAGDQVGTASKRRQAQLVRCVPGVMPVDHRGNVPTRLKKLEESKELSGIILAQAGLERLGMLESEMELLSTDIMLPAVNQGILAVQCRKSDVSLVSRIQSLSTPVLQACFDAERACIATLQADCRSAVSVYAKPISEGEINIKARVFSNDTNLTLEATKISSYQDAVSIGKKVGDDLLAQGAVDLLVA